MKDPTVPTPEDRKKFMFYDSSKRQTMFFRMMITGYLERDENLIMFIESFKQENQLEGRSHTKTIVKSAKASKDTRNKFGLDTADIESFFDIMEEEHPDL